MKNMSMNINVNFKAVSISGARIPKRVSIDYSDEAVQLVMEVETSGIITRCQMIIRCSISRYK